MKRNRHLISNPSVKNYCRGCLATTLLLAMAKTAAAQVHTSYLNRTAPYLPYESFEPSRYNLKWGPLTGRFHGSVTTEFSDNINLSDEDAKADVFIGPNVGVGFLWPVSKSNVMQFDLGLGYRYYVDNTELSALSINPDSHWDYRIQAGDVRINIHDDIAVQVDPLSRSEISGVDEDTIVFRRLVNTAGFAASWQAAKRWLFVGGYDFTLERSLGGDEFEFLDRDTHMFSGSGYYELSPYWTTGLNGYYSLTEYQREIQNDGTSFTIGPVLAFSPSSFLRLHASIGYTESNFDSSGTIADTSDFEGVSFQVGIRHMINRQTSHSLQVSKNTSLGLGSNFTEIWAAQYGINMRLTSAITANASLAYENFDVSGLAGENGDRYLLYLGTGYQLSRRWNLGVAYSFGWKDSNQQDRDYIQNRFTVMLTREF